MKHFGTLFKRYLAETALSPAYIIMTVLYLIVILVGFNFQSIVELFTGDSTEPKWGYVMLDSTEAKSAEMLIGQTIGEGKDAVRFTGLEDIQSDLPKGVSDALQSGADLELSEESAKELRKTLEDASLQGFAYLSEDEDKNLKVKIYSLGELNINNEMTLTGLFSQLNQQRLISELNLPAEDVNRILQAAVKIEAAPIEAQSLDARTGAEKQSGMWVAYFISFVVFFMNTTYSSSLASAIATEKSSRVMEVIVTSVSPRAHLLARILACLVAAFTQLGIMILTAFIVLQFTSMRESIMEMIQTVRPEYLIQCLLLLIVTILFFLVASALLGSLVNTVQDASQAVGPIMLILMAGFYISLSGLFDANNPVICVTSYIPMLSGLVMPMRIGATDLPLYHGWIALGIASATLVVFYIITANIYKGAVITYRTGGLGQKLKSAWELRS